MSPPLSWNLCRCQIQPLAELQASLPSLDLPALVHAVQPDGMPLTGFCDSPGGKKNRNVDMRYCDILLHNTKYMFGLYPCFCFTKTLAMSEVMRALGGCFCYSIWSFILCFWNSSRAISTSPFQPHLSSCYWGNFLESFQGWGLVARATNYD